MPQETRTTRLSKLHDWPDTTSFDSPRPASYNASLSKPGSQIESATEANVIKLDIVNTVADKTGVPKIKAEAAVEALFEAMKSALQRGERIELRGFGVFVVKPRKRGVGRNPRTGEVTDIPPGKTIRFKPGKELQS
jgi:DNA-binding protein HU-beta